MASWVALAACGAPLHGADYPGQPMMQLAGQVLIEDPLPTPQGEVRVAVFWSSQGEHGEQHQQETAVSTAFPARYSLTLYTPPPDEVLYQPPHMSSPAAVGLPMLYDDVDLDGVFDATEQLLGGSQDVLILYALESMGHLPPPGDDTDEPEDDTDDPPVGDPPNPLEPGYHAVRQLGSSCDEDDLVLTEVDPADVSMVVGDLEEFLEDMDCDGDRDEWGEH